MGLVLPFAQPIEAEEPGDRCQHGQACRDDTLRALFTSCRQVVSGNRLLGCRILIRSVSVCGVHLIICALIVASVSLVAVAVSRDNWRWVAIRSWRSWVRRFARLT